MRRLRRFWSVAIPVVVVFRIASPLGAQGPVHKARVGVLDFSESAFRMQTAQVPVGSPAGYGQVTTTTVPITPPSEFARGMTELVTTALIETGRFVVLERSALEQVIGEQDLRGSTRVTAETSQGEGTLLGAQVLIAGDITGFTYERSTVGGRLTNVIKGLSASAERVSAEVVIDLRLIDAGTGQVLVSSGGRGQSSATGVGAELVKGDKDWSGGGVKQTPLGEASRDAIRLAIAELLASMPQLLWTGRVIEVRNGLVYVNAGADDGVSPGQQFDILAPDEPLIDPETGQNLGSPAERVGTVVIEQVEPRFSVGRVVEGVGGERNYLVRSRKAQASGG